MDPQVLHEVVEIVGRVQVMQLTQVQLANMVKSAVSQALTQQM